MAMALTTIRITSRTTTINTIEDGSSMTWTFQS
jgi:hypothetical protein